MDVSDWSMVIKSKSKVLSQASWAHRAALISVSLALSRTPAEAARPRIRVVRVASSGMPVYSPAFAVHINRPRRDGMLSWRWYTAATGGI